MSSPQPDALIVAIARGAKDLALLAQPSVRPDWLLVGGPGFKTVADLKGKILGVSALRGTEQILAEEVFMKKGLKKGDWSAIVVGLTPAKLAALQNSSIAAAVLYQPSAQLAKKVGLNVLAKIADLGDDNVAAYYTINRVWAAKNDHGKRVSRALVRAHEWLWDPKNRKEAIAILQKYTKRTPDVLEDVYDQYFTTDDILETPDRNEERPPSRHCGRGGAWGDQGRLRQARGYSSGGRERRPARVSSDQRGRILSSKPRRDRTVSASRSAAMATLLSLAGVRPNWRRMERI